MEGGGDAWQGLAKWGIINSSCTTAPLNVDHNKAVLGGSAFPLLKGLPPHHTMHVSDGQASEVLGSASRTAPAAAHSPFLSPSPTRPM